MQALLRRESKMKPCRKEFIDGIQRILASRNRKTIDRVSLPHAAVLVPLFEKEGDCHILFTKRSHQVKYHKGQISFPGGTFDPEDVTPDRTALRETFEEVGIRAEDVRLLGAIDDVVTVTNFVVTPFVGLFPYPYPFRVSEVEIAELIEVPLSSLLDKDCLGQRVIRDEYQERVVYAYQYENHTIWGATALILKQLLEMLPPS
jgi:8-oxo-dGTP pyrophosphatase MutT (NUDIX family)